MVGYIATLLLIVLFLWTSSASSNKVIELSDKFLDIYNSTSKSWLIKFYGQSCHLSKKLSKEFRAIFTSKFSFLTFGFSQTFDSRGRVHAGRPSAAR